MERIKQKARKSGINNEWKNRRMKEYINAEKDRSPEAME